ncbi:MAG: hypothetical protein HKN17_06785, partial [Rhodothermales bacterium]|nr:hypothetical protein [Rhodothermales bacterium]
DEEAGDEADEEAEPVAPESAAQDDADEEALPDVQDDTDDGWFSEPDVIRDRASSQFAIQERVGGDGAPARPPSGERSEPVRPAFDHMLTAQEEKSSAGSIQQILGLSDSDVALMNDLGYGTFRSIADLTNEEITRLAETFDVPETRIREEWIPDSRLRAAREPRA